MSTIDLGKIDEQIKRLQDLKRIASDPEMLRLLEGLVIPDGKPETEAENVPHSALNAKPLVRVSVRGKGALIRNTRKVAATMEGPFTAADIVNALRATGFAFAARKPNIAINGALRKLVRTKQIRLIERGSGRRGSRYAAIVRPADGG